MRKNYESGKEVDFESLILKLTPRRPRAYGGVMQIFVLPQTATPSSAAIPTIISAGMSRPFNSINANSRWNMHECIEQREMLLIVLK